MAVKSVAHQPGWTAQSVDVLIQSKKKKKKSVYVLSAFFYTLKQKAGAIRVFHSHTGPENSPLTIMITRFCRCEIRFKVLICELEKILLLLARLAVSLCS